ncbi:MAG: electron transfer flavoprotein subunit alpha/FixB family protein [Chloroflexi bacterium]|nr:electron transfer flavoprotein subunit alpha/FixB family protein [Chloroflexota bacterium]
MADILVYSERDSVAFELLSKARELGSAAAAVLGSNVPATDEFASYGADTVYVGQDARLSDFDAQVCADALAQTVAASGAKVVLLGSTRRGKELAGRLAQKLDAGAITDAIGVEMQEGTLQVQRYALGGNTVAVQVVVTATQVISIMPKTFEAVKKPGGGKVERVALNLRDPRTKVAERKAKAAATADIETAEALVLVGKGFAKQSDLSLAENLAKVMKAEIGCTRALSADYHWLGEERMVGISGKKVKPRLLVSIGISGQIQHTVGILGSKWIVAINKDKSAPIFKMADYGIVGDLYQVLPTLSDKIANA